MASVTCCTIIKEHAGLTESVEALVEQKSAIARALYLEGISFVKGFADFHDVVKNHGLKSAIATNALDDTLHLTEQALRLSRFFGEHRYGISRVNYVSKPAPDIYLHAAEKLQVAPRHCIAIEDSPAGIKAAKAAGMYCIGINTGRRRHALAEADCIVERYEDIQLSGILKKQP
jgi:beta-phosphoglucomutase-like phosphatase (HAD superfamily)